MEKVKIGKEQEIVEMMECFMDTSSSKSFLEFADEIEEYGPAYAREDIKEIWYDHIDEIEEAFA